MDTDEKWIQTDKSWGPGTDVKDLGGWGHILQGKNQHKNPFGKNLLGKLK